MRSILMGLITLITMNLNAQDMETAQDKVIKLFVATDQRDWSKVAASFDANVTLDYSSMTGNPAAELAPEQIVAAWKGILPGFESTHHQLGNFIVTEKPDAAEVFCYGTASHYLDDENGNLWTVIGTYDFGLVKTEGVWKI